MTRRSFPALGTGVVAGALVAVALGLGLVAVGRWREGLGLAGVALGVAGLLRLVLSRRHTGGLRVRKSRFVDAAVMLGMGITLVVLAVVVPDRPPAP